jgi:hypothetical protein
VSHEKAPTHRQLGLVPTKDWNKKYVVDVSGITSYGSLHYRSQFKLNGAFWAGLAGDTADQGLIVGSFYSDTS